jgi:hypothetical protein
MQRGVGREEVVVKQYIRGNRTGTELAYIGRRRSFTSQRHKVCALVGLVRELSRRQRDIPAATEAFWHPTKMPGAHKLPGPGIRFHVDRCFLIVNGWLGWIDHKLVNTVLAPQLKLPRGRLGSMCYGA